MFRVKMSTNQKKDRRKTRTTSRLKFIAASIAFAIILGAVFDRNLWKLFNAGGNLPGTIEGMFTV